MAVLCSGLVVTVDQPTFPVEPPRRTSFAIVADSIYEEQEVWSEAPRTGLYIHNDFRNSTILLDGSYFAANSFKNCKLLYNGGNTVFVPNQEVTTSTLNLSKTVDQRSLIASHLTRDFRWSRVTIGD